MSYKNKVFSFALVIGLSVACNQNSRSKCYPGYEYCQCQYEKCFDGLTCISNICIEMSEETSTGETEDICQTYNECEDDELCVEEKCESIYNFDYDVKINYFEPSSCSDGWGSAELYFQYIIDGNTLHTTYESSCPAHWDMIDLPRYNPLLSFQIKFWEADALEDDLLLNFCWNDLTANCGSVPIDILREGFFEVNSTYKLEIEFNVIE